MWFEIHKTNVYPTRAPTITYSIHSHTHCSAPLGYYIEPSLVSDCSRTPLASTHPCFQQDSAPQDRLQPQHASGLRTLVDIWRLFICCPDGIHMSLYLKHPSCGVNPWADRDRTDCLDGFGMQASLLWWLAYINGMGDEVG